MVEWSIAAFRACPSVGPIVVACPSGHEHDLAGPDLDVVEGGETRAHSVSNALGAVETDLVAIHDAARPLVTPELIEAVVATLVDNPEAVGAIVAAPVTDTIKQTTETASDSGRNAFSMHMDEKALRPVERTLDRGRLWAAQTPQVFRGEALRSALESAPEVAAATDEASLVEAAGGKVLIHPSSAENLKVTTPLDLKLAELALAERSAQQ